MRPPFTRWFYYLRLMHEAIVYEPVIGLEVHVQLLTQSKLFCGDSTRFGNAPNTNISAISLAHPGTLPVMNEEALELAIRLGLAFGCDITHHNYFSRKNYFYPDLPKGYQVTQDTTPICRAGGVQILVNGKSRIVKLNRIHLEEDAGKSVHDSDDENTCVDLNRAGVPLLEIVSEPDLFSAEEAFAFVTEIRRMVRYLDVCDGNMEEGSMRCDANISVRPVGSSKLGTRVEVKNLNSVRNVKRAIEYEVSRLTGILQNGETVQQQTRSFDANNGTTFSLRTKEEANDYRYFPEPDLAPFVVTHERIEKIRRSLPALPGEVEKRLINEMGLHPETARIIADERSLVTYFKNATEENSLYKAVANWLTGPVKAYLNEQHIDIVDFPLSPVKLGALAGLVEHGKLSFTTASSHVFPALLKEPDREPAALAASLNVLLERDDELLNEWVDEVIAGMPDKVESYRKGKKNLVGLFAGEVKRRSKGKADMKMVNEILIKKLNQ